MALKRNIVLLILFTTLASCQSAPIETDNGSPPEAEEQQTETILSRSLWVWTTELILTNTDEQNTFFEFLSNWNISRIYLSTGFLRVSNNTETENYYKAFLEMAHEEGYLVEALMGDPGWVDDYIADPNTENVIQTILNFHNATEDSNQQFDGIHLDVEPHAHDDWDTENRQTLIDNFVTAMTLIQNQISSQSNLKTTADLGWFFSEFETSSGDNLFEKCHELFDEVVLMAYLPHSSTHYDNLVRDQILYAGEESKPLSIGLEADEGLWPNGANDFLERTMVFEEDETLENGLSSISWHSYQITKPFLEN